MRIVNYNPDFYPYGVMMQGDDWRIAYMPELRVLPSRRNQNVPMDTLKAICASMNRRVRAGDPLNAIEADHQELFDHAATRRSPVPVSVVFHGRVYWMHPEHYSDTCQGCAFQDHQCSSSALVHEFEEAAGTECSRDRLIYVRGMPYREA